MYTFDILFATQQLTELNAMTTLTVNIPDFATSELSKFLQDLGGEVVEVVAEESAEAKLEEGLCEVKAIREGKMKGLSLADILG